MSIGTNRLARRAGAALVPAAMALGLAFVGLAGTSAPAAAQAWQACASEGGVCRVPYPTVVRYGARGSFAYIRVGGGSIRCNNATFGDPIRGIGKSCAFELRRTGWGPDPYPGPGFPGPGFPGPGFPGPGFPGPGFPGPGFPGPGPGFGGGWELCAREGGYCDFRGRAEVRYGVPGRWVYGTFRNGIECNNSVFGDPARGRGKVCEIRD
jgi:hypothetical protein